MHGNILLLCPDVGQGDAPNQKVGNTHIGQSAAYQQRFLVSSKNSWMASSSSSLSQFESSSLAEGGVLLDLMQHHLFVRTYKTGWQGTFCRGHMIYIPAFVFVNTLPCKRSDSKLQTVSDLMAVI